MNENNVYSVPQTSVNTNHREKKPRGSKTPVVIALIAALAAIACVSIFSISYVKYKKSANSSGITATGSASQNFESDLVVWRGSFSTYGYTPREAYQTIKQDADTVKKYLLDNKISEDEIVFSSVTISPNYVTDYNDEGNYVGEHLDGYNLCQEITVTSTDLNKVDAVSRDISKLIESNITFISESPEYYYTKLDELKLELIEQATENARARIDIIAAGSKSKPTRLINANLGVFQITPQNSDTEYSYGGSFDTSSRLKTATITVKLNYAVD